MKSEDVKNVRAKTGVSRLWIGVGAVAGAAIAYLADPERGNARRQTAFRQVSGSARAAAAGTQRWRQMVSARLPGRTQGKPPAQVTVPSEPRSAAAAPSRSKRVVRPTQTGADPKKPVA